MSMTPLTPDPVVHTPLTERHRELVLQRWCLHAGTFALIFLFLGFGGFAQFFFPPPSPGLSATEIAAVYQENPNGIRLGMLTFFTATTLWAPFVLAITRQIELVTGPRSTLPQLQVILGIGSWIFLIVPGLVLAAAAFRPDRPVEITQALHDLGWILAIMPFAPFTLQAVVLAVATFLDREGTVFPRWFGYLNILLGLSFLPGMFLIFFKDGPLAYNGLLAFWIPVVDFGIWMLAIIVVVGRSITTQQAVLTADATSSPTG